MGKHMKVAPLTMYHKKSCLIQINRSELFLKNHEKQRELTETRKKLKDVSAILPKYISEDSIIEIFLKSHWYQVFTNMGHDDEDDSVIGIKRLGEINIKPFYRDPCSNAKAAKKCSWWQQKIESHSWRPFKGITIKGRYEVIQVGYQLEKFSYIVRNISFPV